MKSPREKYENDQEYNYLVNMLESLIERANFTPSELREAAVLAAINYEMRHVRSIKQDPELMRAMDVLDKRFARKTRGR